MADHTHVIADITDFPTSLPASDVPAWAKAKRKPIYCWSDIHCKPNLITSVTVDGEQIEFPKGELKLENVTKGLEKTFNVRFNNLAKTLKFSNITDDLQFGQRIRNLELTVSEDVAELKRNYGTLVSQNTRLVSDFNTLRSEYESLEREVDRRVDAIEVITNNCVRNCEQRNLAQDQAILDAIEKAENDLSFAKRELNSAIASCRSSCADAHNRFSSQIADLETETFRQGREIVWLKEHMQSVENDLRNINLDVESKIANSTTISQLRSEVAVINDGLTLVRSEMASTKTGVFARLNAVEALANDAYEEVEQIRASIPTVPTKLSQFENDLNLDYSKVEASATNGNIKLNGTELKVYDDTAVRDYIQQVAENSTKVIASPINGYVKVDGTDVKVYDESALKGRLDALEAKTTNVTASSTNGNIKVDNAEVKVYDDTAVTTDIADLKTADTAIKADIKAIQDAGYVTAEEAKELASFELTQSGKGSTTYLTVTGSQGTLIVNGETVTVKRTTDVINDLEAEVTALKTRLAALETVVAEITQCDCATLKARVDALATTVEEIEGNVEELETKSEKALTPVPVEALPTTGEEGKIYLIKSTGEEIEGNKYDEYVWVDDKFEKLGSGSDAPTYYSEEELEELLR